jgi:hypothetical protein
MTFEKIRTQSFNVFRNKCLSIFIEIIVYEGNAK